MPSADGVVGPRELGLLDPLLALFGVEVAGRAQATLMPLDELPDQFVLLRVVDGVPVALDGPGPRVQLRPVDLS